MELGIMSFADMEPEKQAGSGISAHQRIKDLINGGSGSKLGHCDGVGCTCS